MMGMSFLLGAMALGGAAIADAPAGERVPMAKPGPVLELRQYKIVDGKRDAFVDFFEKHFVETQDAVGMPLLGQFRDIDDGNRFVWMRSFATMDDRRRALTDFYTGPVWQANKATANPMLDDNDNVLLLRPARADSGFAAPAPRPGPGRGEAAHGLIVANIHYLWKEPADGFADFFFDRMAPALRAAGIEVLGAYVTEKAENSFPRLPVRQSERVFVWFTRARDAASYRQTMATLAGSAPWRKDLARPLAEYSERQLQTVFLSPTPRSALR